MPPSIDRKELILQFLPRSLAVVEPRWGTGAVFIMRGTCTESLKATYPSVDKILINLENIDNLYDFITRIAEQNGVCTHATAMAGVLFPRTRELFSLAIVLMTANTIACLAMIIPQ